MTVARRNAPLCARRVLAALLCVACVVATLFLGRPALAGSRVSVLEQSAALAIATKGPSITCAEAPASFAESAVAPRDRAARLAGDVPEGRDGASARASASAPRGARLHERPVDAAWGASHPFHRAPLFVARSRRCETSAGSAPSAARLDHAPASVDRDLHAPRGPPSRPLA